MLPPLGERSRSGECCRDRCQPTRSARPVGSPRARCSFCSASSFLERLGQLYPELLLELRRLRAISGRRHSRGTPPMRCSGLLGWWASWRRSGLSPWCQGGGGGGAVEGGWSLGAPRGAAAGGLVRVRDESCEIAATSVCAADLCLVGTHFVSATASRGTASSATSADRNTHARALRASCDCSGIDASEALVRRYPGEADRS